MRDWAIMYFGERGSGPRLGVKDLIDIEGAKTSAGSRLVLSTAQVAKKDALLLEGARRQGAQIVAKTNLNELAFGSTGINPWFGTPLNPLNPELVPGGSSSGSAVGVATDELDLSFGSDTGGSIRIPSACCGVFGLKTTQGRVPLDGVWPLSQSLDTVGPMAADSKRLEEAMALLEPGFSARKPDHSGIALIEGSGDSEILTAILGVLGLTEFEIDSVADPGLVQAREAGIRIMFKEALENNRALLIEAHRLDPAIVERFAQARSFTESDLAWAVGVRSEFRSRLDELLSSSRFLALPTLKVAVPSLGAGRFAPLNANTMPFNLAGLPAIAIPVALSVNLKRYLNLGDGFAPMGLRAGGAQPMPLSIQIVGREDTEDELIGLAQLLEEVLKELDPKGSE